ncbi:MAG: substrate-binding domain-containing protein [Planctomycetota bacterium]
MAKSTGWRLFSVLILAAFIAGCTGDSGDGGGGSGDAGKGSGDAGQGGGDSSGGGEAAKGAGGAAGGQKRIVILTNGTSPFWDAAKKGAQDAAAALNADAAGLKVVVHTNDFSDKGQIDALKRYQTMSDIVGVGISVTNSANPQIPDELRKLQKKGVHIVAIDSDVDRANDRNARAAYIGTDNVYGGEELGKAAKGLLPEGGKYAAFVGLKGAANAKERFGGFGKGAGEKFQSTDFFGDNGDKVKAKTNVRDAINRNPDLKVLVGIWSYNAPAIVDIVKETKRREKTTIVCFDAEPVAIDHMEEKMIDTLAVQNPYLMGYEGVRMLKALHEKDNASIEEMRKRMVRGTDKDVFDTGLKIIIPDDPNPLDAVKFGDFTQKMKLKDFKAWLKTKGLSGS